MNEDKRPLMVTIRCCTYNHESYIRQCLEGFVMQKTNFRFEAIVHDDASTDGTATIVKEYAEKYPDIIKPIFETENQYSKHDGSLQRIMNEHTYGKYVAFCEGDDYWIDPLKLQKQVDFLEEHEDYGAVYTDFKSYYQSTGKWGRVEPQTRFFSGYVYEIMISSRLRIWTLTTCCRTSIYKESLCYIPKEKSDKFFMGDRNLFLYITSKWKVKAIEEEMAVYRVLNESASHFIHRKSYLQHEIKVLRLMLYYLANGPQIRKDLYRKLSKVYQIKKIPYCLYFKDSDEFSTINLTFTPIISTKYFFVWWLYFLCQYKVLFRFFSKFYIKHINESF